MLVNSLTEPKPKKQKNSNFDLCFFFTGPKEEQLKREAMLPMPIPNQWCINENRKLND